QVLALTVYNGNLIASGLFTSAGGTSASHVAQWNGGSWAPLGGGTAYAAGGSIEYNLNLVLGSGSFTYGLGQWNGANRQSLGGPGGAGALAVYNGDLVAGGQYPDPYNGMTVVVKWNGSSWRPLVPGFNGAVNAFAMHNGTLVAGGDFSAAG